MIRDAFFQTGGNVPVVSLAIRPPVVAGCNRQIRNGRHGGPRPKAPADLQSDRTAPSTAYRQYRAHHCAVAGRLGAHRHFGHGIWRTTHRAGTHGSMVAVPHAGGRHPNLRGETATATYLFGGQEFRFQITIRLDQEPAEFGALCENSAVPAGFDLSCAADCSESCLPNATSLRCMRRDRCSTYGSRGCRAACRPAGIVSTTHWQQAFLTAPIWRFWLGADICGTTVTGALMSSLDGVGRYYPLTVFAIADPTAPIPPPDIDAQDAWFTDAEQFLLSTLDRDISYETTTAALDSLAQPACQAAPPLADGMELVKDGIVAAPAGERSFLDLCGSLRAANHGSVYAAASFWWTLGGGDYQPIGLCCRRMPDPFLFTSMLTGQFKSAAA